MEHALSAYGCWRSAGRLCFACRRATTFAPDAPIYHQPAVVLFTVGDHPGVNIITVCMECLDRMEPMRQDGLVQCTACRKAMPPQVLDRKSERCAYHWVEISLEPFRADPTERTPLLRVLCCAKPQCAASIRSHS